MQGTVDPKAAEALPKLIALLGDENAGVRGSAWPPLAAADEAVRLIDDHPQQDGEFASFVGRGTRAM